MPKPVIIYVSIPNGESEQVIAQLLAMDIHFLEHMIQAVCLVQHKARIEGDMITMSAYEDLRRRIEVEIYRRLSSQSTYSIN